MAEVKEWSLEVTANKTMENAKRFYSFANSASIAV
jgi:Tat protein secretion system quality control protein TatD with DNase activity